MKIRIKESKKVKEQIDWNRIEIDWDEISNTVTGKVGTKLAFLIDDVDELIDLGDISYFGDDDGIMEYIEDNDLIYRNFRN